VRCKEVLTSVVTGEVVLVCDLDECHGSVLDFHYDDLEDAEWRQREVPALVPVTDILPVLTEYAAA